MPSVLECSGARAVVPIHRHPTKDESFVILRGKVGVTTHNDDGSIIEDVVLSQESGNYGVDIPKNVWHMVEAFESGGCISDLTNRSQRWILMTSISILSPINL